jgi:hypothetical protein
MNSTIVSTYDKQCFQQLIGKFQNYFIVYFNYNIFKCYTNYKLYNYLKNMAVKNGSKFKIFYKYSLHNYTINLLMKYFLTDK